MVMKAILCILTFVGTCACLLQGKDGAAIAFAILHLAHVISFEFGKRAR